MPATLSRMRAHAVVHIRTVPIVDGGSSHFDPLVSRRFVLALLQYFHGSLHKNALRSTLVFVGHLLTLPRRSLRVGMAWMILMRCTSRWRASGSCAPLVRQAQHWHIHGPLSIVMQLHFPLWERNLERIGGGTEQLLRCMENTLRPIDCFTSRGMLLHPVAKCLLFSVPAKSCTASNRNPHVTSIIDTIYRCDALSLFMDLGNSYHAFSWRREEGSTKSSLHARRPMAQICRRELANMKFLKRPVPNSSRRACSASHSRC